MLRVSYTKTLKKTIWAQNVNTASIQKIKKK